jgi:hypothetical protein
LKLILWPLRFVIYGKIGQDLAYANFGNRVKCANSLVFEYVTELCTGCFMAHDENYGGSVLELFLKFMEQRCIHIIGHLGGIDELHDESV